MRNSNEAMGWEERFEHSSWAEGRAKGNDNWEWEENGAFGRTPSELCYRLLAGEEGGCR